MDLRELLDDADIRFAVGALDRENFVHGSDMAVVSNSSNDPLDG